MSQPVLLAFGPGTWRHPHVFGSPRYHLWCLAKRGWRVLYVEPPVKLRLRPATWNAPDRPFTVLSPALVPPFAVRYIHGRAAAARWRALTASRLASEARRHLARERLTPDVAWYGAPWHAAIAARLQPAPPFSVTHVYDELPLSPAFNRAQSALLWQWEQELLSRVDIACCSSLPQLEKRRPHARRVELLENAIPDSFLPEHRDPPSAEINGWLRRLRELPRPRIVYGGVVDHRLDPSLFLALLATNLVGSLVFLGKLDPNLDPVLREAISLTASTHALGPIPHAAYPHLYAEADVLVLLHRRNPFTDAMYPEKLNEYLASGRPILSINLPEVARVAGAGPPRPLVRLVHGTEDIAGALAQCLADRDPSHAEARIALAREHTWNAMADRLDRTLRDLLDGAPPSK